LDPTGQVNAWDPPVSSQHIALLDDLSDAKVAEDQPALSWVPFSHTADPKLL